MVFGLPWLKQHNPSINWVKGEIDLENFGQVRRILEVFQKIVETLLVRKPTTLIIEKVLKPLDTPKPIIKRIQSVIQEMKQTVVQKIKRSFRATTEEVVDDSNEGKPGNTPSEDWQPLLLTMKEAEEEGDLNLLRTYLGKDTPETQTEDTTWIQANQTKAQEFAQLAEEKDEKPKTLLPEFYKKYASVFDKDTLE